MSSPGKRHVEEEKNDVQQKSCKVNYKSVPSQVRLLKEHKTKLWLNTSGSHGGHEFTDLDEQDELVNTLGLRDGYTLLYIGDLSVTMFEHDLVVDMLRHLEAGEEDSSITIKKTSSIVKIIIKELSYDSETGQIIIKVHEEIVSGDKSGDIEDLVFVESPEVHIFKNDKAIKWCNDDETSSVMACPMSNRNDHFVFYRYNYRGWDATDSCVAYLNTVAAFTSKDLYLYAYKKEVHLIKSTSIDLKNLDKQKPMLFRITKFNDMTFFESFAYEGRFIACDESGNVFMKKVGKNKTAKDLELIPEIQFNVQRVTPLRITSL